MKTLLVNFYVDCGRMGDLHGKILIREEVWNALQSRRWYASEVLGKYSEVEGNFSDENDFSVQEITDVQLEFLTVIFNLDLENLDKVGYSWEVPTICIAGFNPFDHIREEEEED